MFPDFQRQVRTGYIVTERIDHPASSEYVIFSNHDYIHILEKRVVISCHQLPGIKTGFIIPESPGIGTFIPDLYFNVHIASVVEPCQDIKLWRLSEHYSG